MAEPTRAHPLPHDPESFFARGHRTAAACGPGFQMLWHAMERTAQSGKRFRPALAAAAYRGLGGRDDIVEARLGEAIELLHNALLLHDDVIDHDDTRRGVSNVSGVFIQSSRTDGASPERAATLGAAAGILAGDLALVGAMRLVALVPVPAPLTHRLLDLVEHAVCLTAAGELADVRFSLDLEPHSLGDILTMEERKTAVYSFVLPLQAGAICAGASQEVVAGLNEYGRLLGVAFQLLDDLLGVFGNPAQSGKSALSDLREGKCTALIAHARTTPAWPQISQHFGDPALTEERAEVLRRGLEECGSRRFIEELASDYRAAAWGVMASLPLPDELIGALAELTDDLTRRVA